MHLNVIIPAFNASKTIGQTLKSVWAQRDAFKGDFDITVVDSSDPLVDSTHELITTLDVPINYIQLPERAYPGKARNKGVENSKGDILCFIDADAYADSGWLTSIHDFMDANPGIAAVGGPVLNANPKEGQSQLAHWCEFSGYGANAPEGKRRVQPTVNVAIRRNVFESCGPFLEDQFGNEDVLLFSRMNETGEELHFNGKMRVYHRNKWYTKAIYRHQYTLGECTGKARVNYDLPGSFLARPGGSLLVPLIKTHFVGWRLLTQETSEWPAFLLKWPLVLTAMTHFARGFRDGVEAAGRGNK